jgi:hypothetical protein
MGQRSTRCLCDFISLTVTGPNFTHGQMESHPHAHSFDRTAEFGADAIICEGP